MGGRSAAGGVPLLHLVAGGDQPTVLDVAKRLLAEGADADMAEDEDGLTPLHVACHWDRLAMAQLLILHGADPLKQDNHGRTPLSMATGDTKKFVERMLARSEPERRSALHRIFQLHFGTKLSKALRGAKKRVRRTIAFMLPSSRRQRSTSEGGGQQITSSTPRPSISAQSATGSVGDYITANEESISGRDTVAATATRNRTLAPTQPTPSTSAKDENVTRRKQRTKCKQDTDVDEEWQPGHTDDEDNEIVYMVKKDGKATGGNSSSKGPVIQSKKKNDQSSQSPSGVKRTGESRMNVDRKTPDGEKSNNELEKQITGWSEQRLRRELKTIGIEAGPMGSGKGLRKAYERKLVEAMKELGIGDDPSSTGIRYSRPLELAMAGRAWQSGAAIAADESVRSIFINKGCTAFCYLLLDPRHLPPKADDVTLAQLVNAIFYIGKGTKARPLQHLIDAKRERDSNRPRLSAKLTKICDIWAADVGVISLQLSHNVCDEEALTREAVLIEAINIRNLTNERAGKHYGGVSAWQPVARAQLGTLMLKRSLGVLVAEGLRPIQPQALPDTLFRPFPTAARPRTTTHAPPTRKVRNA